MLKITSLGGCGEDSRNCFLLQSGERSVLLDCGVRREIADVSEVYPLLTREIAENLDAVFLSHAHEDHTAALPYLYELGYRGYVYASAETISLTPTFLLKWVYYVKNNGGELPFPEDNIDSIRFRNIEDCPIKLSYGRDGHITGGLWYLFELDGQSLLYTGDLTYDSLLLQADPLPEADTLVIDSAYADRHLDQAEQYRKLLETARDVIASGGRLLLPVPANGRGIDMFVYLSRFDLPLFVENSIVKKTKELFQQRKWIKPFDFPCENYTVVSNSSRDELLRRMRAGVYLFGDGMMTTAAALKYFEAVRDDSRSKIIISGHSARGTLANQLLQRDFIIQNDIKASAEQLTIKVHNDFDDVISLVKTVRPKNVMLFHCKKTGCKALAEKLTGQGIHVLTNVGEQYQIN